MYDEENRPSGEETPPMHSQQPGEQSSPGFDYGTPAPLYTPPAPPAQPAAQATAPPPPLRRRSAVWGALGAAALIIIGAVTGSATTWYLGQRYAPQAITLQGSAPAQPVVLQGEASAITDVFKRVGPAVVRIQAVVRTGGGTFQFGPFGFRQGPQMSKDIGSGFIFDGRGYILTNNHVVDSAQNVTVFFQDGASYEGKVVGTDPASDLAVVKIDPGRRELTVATLGDSDKVQVGEPAIAIGAPFNLDHTVTAGIISGINRSTQEQNGNQLPGMLQTDASVNPGNSGGPLLDAAGNVIGINTAIESPVQGSVGIGFAIPINQAKAELPTLMAGKRPQHPAIGILGMGIGDLDQRISPRPDHGVVIAGVMRGSPADKAGLQGATLDQNQNVVRLADVILGIEGKPVNSIADIAQVLATRQVGDKVTAEIWNRGATRQVTLTLESREQLQRQESSGNND